tara:strand:+ start:143 stop:346 length:204 start_codon:yes stop_codon:yes gene_type:complete
MKNKTLLKIKELKSEEKALVLARSEIKDKLNAERRKIYAKHSSKLNQIDRRLNAIDDHIFELCELIK